MMTFIDTVYQCLKQAKVASASWRSEAQENYGFVAGDQYKTEDRQLLESQMRPIITFNRVSPIIDAVSGVEIANRQEISYLPRNGEDREVSRLFTSAAKWVREQCDAADEESDAFIDVLISGVGWTETRIDYEQDREGKVIIERVDPVEIFWDPNAIKRNLLDAKWIIRVKKVTQSDLKLFWPDNYEEILSGDCDSDEIHNQNSMYDIIEYQWLSREKYYRVYNPFSKSVEKLNEQSYLKFCKKVPNNSINAVPIFENIYKRAFVCNKVILEQGISPAGKNGFTYKAITGKRDRNKKTWYGLVNSMKDPQRWANKWLSQVLHIMNSNAKGGLLVEQGAFVNPQKAEEEWSNPSSITFLKEGGLRKVTPKPLAQFPASLENLMSFAVSSIYDVTGINQEFLGTVNRPQAGILEYQRKQAGLHLLSVFFDSFRRYKKEHGRLLLHFITHYISDGRLIRIYGNSGEDYVPLIRQPDTGIYDVIVDEAPSSPDRKEQVFSVLMRVVPLFIKAGIPIPKDIIQYLPLPESLTEQWVSEIQPNSVNVLHEKSEV